VAPEVVKGTLQGVGSASGKKARWVPQKPGGPSYLNAQPDFKRKLNGKKTGGGKTWGTWLRRQHHRTERGRQLPVSDWDAGKGKELWEKMNTPIQERKRKSGSSKIE